METNIGKEILKILLILALETFVIIIAGKFGLNISMPIVLLVSAGLVRVQVINMYNIAKQSEEMNNNK